MHRLPLPAASYLAPPPTLGSALRRRPLPRTPCTLATSISVAGWGSGALDKAWRGFGWMVLVGSAAFMVAFLPAPLLFLVWAVGLTPREISGVGGAERVAA